MSKVIRSFQDAEIAIGQIVDELARLRRSGASAQDLLGYVSKSELESKIQRINFRPGQASSVPQVLSNDTDSNVQNSIVYHNLRHYFREPILSDEGLILPGDSLTGRWYIKTELNSRVDLVFQYRDPITPANNFDMKLDFAGVATFSGLLSPSLTNTFDVGNSSLLWRSGYFGTSVNIAASGIASIFRGASYSAASGTTSRIELRRGRGTESAPTDVLIGDRLGTIINYGYRNGAFRAASYFDCYVNFLPGASAIAADLYVVTTDTAGSTGNRWNFHPDGNFLPVAAGAYDVGESATRVRKVWAVDIDVSGTITGSGLEVNSQLSANASASPTVTTTFADLSGATVSLNRNGTWLIVCTIVGSKEINDDEIQAQLVYDGTAQNGIIRMAASTANFIRTTGTRSWPIAVTGQPKTAKIQVKKNAGTGFSTVDTVNSNIVAIFINS